eukprot:1296997-Amphidinium_carterae.2
MLAAPQNGHPTDNLGELLLVHVSSSLSANITSLCELLQRPVTNLRQYAFFRLVERSESQDMYCYAEG